LQSCIVGEVLLSDLQKVVFEKDRRLRIQKNKVCLLRLTQSRELESSEKTVQILDAIEKSLKAIEEEIGGLRIKRQDMSEEIKNAAKNNIGEIVVNKKFTRGNGIQIGNYSLRVKDDYDNIRFKYDKVKNRIVIESLK